MPTSVAVESLPERIDITGYQLTPDMECTSVTNHSSVREMLAIASIFMVLVVWKWSSLTLPPYEDQAIAVWAEAEFLAKTNFNYTKLRYDEPNFMDGGEYRSYMISAIPTVIASLMRSLPSIDAAILAAHLINLFCVAVILRSLFMILAAPVGRLLATLTTLSFVTLPAMQCPIETLGMEVPLMAAAFVCARLFFAGHYVLAGVTSLLPFFMKASGALITLTGIATLTLLSIPIAQGDARHRGKALFGLSAFLFAFSIERRFMKWSGDPVLEFTDYAWPDLVQLSAAVDWCPDLVVIFVITVSLTVLWVCRELDIFGWPIIGPGFVGFLRNALLFIRRHPMEVFIIVLIAGTIAAMLQYIFIVRYILLALAFLMVLLARRLTQVSPILAGALLLVLIGVNLANGHGHLYRPIVDIGARQFARNTYWSPRVCAFTERSGEYRDDLIETMKAADFLAAQSPDTVIIADWLLWTYLRRPMLGYVPTGRMAVVNSRNLRELLEAIKFSAAKGTRPHLLFVYSARNSTTVPDPGDIGAELLFQDSLTPNTKIYRLAQNEWDRLRADPVDWYLDATWKDTMSAQRAVERFDLLRFLGQTERARFEIEEALRNTTKDEQIFYPHVVKYWLQLRDRSRGGAR